MPGSEDVLLVDDDEFVCQVVVDLLGRNGFPVKVVSSGQEAYAEVQGGFRGVVVLDRVLPDIDGTELLPLLLEMCPTNPVVLLTGHGSLDLALDSIQTGAFEFLDKSELMARLVPCVHAAALRFREFNSASQGADSRKDATRFPEIVTRSREMKAVFRTLLNALDSSVTVLIQGESGTGKELVASAIHENGPRASGPFVALNCAGIPENLLEAEIFGYERGAFTGATSRKPGKFELAQGGTLLLDEIGEMHPTLQAKLLRVIQSGEYQRLGGVETLYADVRVLSSTNRNLEREVELGRFRADLYYRLAVFTVYLPPLRERAGDIAVLSEHFVREYSRLESRNVNTIDKNAMELLGSYNFPGNIRELQNIISYAVISSRNETLTIADFPPNFLRAVRQYRWESGQSHKPVFHMPEPPDVYIPVRAAGDEEARQVAKRPFSEPALPGKASVGSTRDLSASADVFEHAGGFRTLEEVEAAHINKALVRTGGNKAQAARLLGISRVTLYRRLAAPN